MNQVGNVYLKNLLALGVILLLSICVFSSISANGSGHIFSPESTEQMTAENTQTIETQVEIAGGYFLDAHSNIARFSNRIEMSNVNGMDYSEWNNVLDSALSNIKNARTSYAGLIKIAETTPYNMQVVYRLRYFDYDGFRGKYNLNRIVFNEVKGYLYNGDIMGVYRRMYATVAEMERLLLIIKNDVSANTMPKLSTVWELNEKSADLLIFGQYVARVFYAI